jgi:hypothetical protein
VGAASTCTRRCLSANLQLQHDGERCSSHANWRMCMLCCSSLGLAVTEPLNVLNYQQATALFAGGMEGRVYWGHANITEITDEIVNTTTAPEQRCVLVHVTLHARSGV